jgi:hypothetical protein
MNKQIMNKWTNALKNGSYKQTDECCYLRKRDVDEEDYYYTALAVLEDIHMEEEEFLTEDKKLFDLTHLTSWNLYEDDGFLEVTVGRKTLKVKVCDYWNTGDPDSIELRKKTARWAGLVTTDPTLTFDGISKCLSDWELDGKTFKELAEAIERQL